MKKQAFEALITGLTISAPSRENIMKMYLHFGFDTVFSRADVMKVTEITATPATDLKRKMKSSKLIESASRGKYKFSEPQD